MATSINQLSGSRHIDVGDVLLILRQRGAIDGQQFQRLRAGIRDQHAIATRLKSLLKHLSRAGISMSRPNRWWPGTRTI